MSKKVLYYFNGYLSDKVKKDGSTISSPDGNFSYSPWLIQEFQKRNWEVYCCQNKDKQIVEDLGKDAFKSFSQDKRFNAYNKINWVGREYPDDIDLVVNEWRFPTKDNSKNVGDEGYSPDLAIQNELVSKYAGNTPYAIWDLDYKLSKKDIHVIKPTKILEQALFTKYGGPSFNCPMDLAELTQFPMTEVDPNKLAVYIGNDYNRRADFDKKFMLLGAKHPGKVHLVGNWLKDSLKEYREKNDFISYHGRIGASEFYEHIHDAACVPLLATPEYKERGFMTMRVMETLLFGSIPVGFSDFAGIDQYLPRELIASTPRDFESKALALSKLNQLERTILRNKVIKKIGPMFDSKLFVDKLLDGCV